MRHLSPYSLLAGEMQQIGFVVLERMVEMHNQNTFGRLVNAVYDLVVPNLGATVSHGAEERIFAEGEFSWHGLQFA